MLHTKAGVLLTNDKVFHLFFNDPNPNNTNVNQHMLKECDLLKGHFDFTA